LTLQLTRQPPCAIEQHLSGSLRFAGNPDASMIPLLSSSYFRSEQYNKRVSYPATVLDVQYNGMALPISSDNTWSNIPGGLKLYNAASYVDIYARALQHRRCLGLNVTMTTEHRNTAWVLYGIGQQPPPQVGRLTGWQYQPDSTGTVGIDVALISIYLCHLA